MYIMLLSMFSVVGAVCVCLYVLSMVKNVLKFYLQSIKISCHFSLQVYTGIHIIYFSLGILVPIVICVCCPNKIAR